MHKKNSKYTLNNELMEKRERRDREQLTFLYNAMRFDSSKGKNPAIKTKRITPHDHKSAFAPS